MAALKTSLKPTTTVETTTEVKMSVKARQMLVSRLEEHQEGCRIVREWKGTKKTPGRLKRIEQEVEDLFKKEKQGKALVDGTALDGHRLKHTGGTTKVFDKQGFLKHHGLTEADYNAFVTEKPKTAFIKFTHPDSEDDE
jgi:hypothetical protein